MHMAAWDAIRSRIKDFLQEEIVKKNLFMFLVVCAAVTSLWAAGSKEKKGQIFVAVSINTYNNFHSVFYGAVEEYAKANNITLRMADAQNNAQKQVSDVENLLALNPDAFILLPVDTNAQGVCVDAIKDMGIPLVESSTWTVNDRFDVFIGADDTSVGRSQGEFIAAYLDANPQVNLKAGYLHILYGSPLDKMRLEGLLTTLDKYIKSGRFEIIADADGLATGDYSSSLTATEDWMQAYPQMNAIIGQNDGTAVAAMQAVLGAGKKDVLICGADAEGPAVAAILDGTMAMSAMLEPAKWGRLCIETIAGLLQGKTYEKFNLITPVPITKENAAKVSNYQLID
jgi:ABC-type sugar transport system substrate-binding protein